MESEKTNRVTNMRGTRSKNLKGAKSENMKGDKLDNMNKSCQTRKYESPNQKI